MKLRRSCHYFALLIITFLIVACATPTQYAESKNQAPQDPIGSYQRDRQEAPPPPPFQPFGGVQGNQLALWLNNSLLSEQSATYCQGKPVQRVGTPPSRHRRCTRTTYYGCAEYDAYPGENQPPCMSKHTDGNCVAREDPNKITFSYRTVQDCYPTTVDAADRGRIRVFAVPEKTTRENVTRSGREIATFTLAEIDKPYGIDVPTSIKYNECLALVDTGGKVINTRGTNQDPTGHLFATERMITVKKIARAQTAVDEATAKADALKGDLEVAKEIVQKSGAWQRDQCITPAAEQLPPEPKTLSRAEILPQVQAYCVIQLMNELPTGDVLQAIASAEEHEYTDAFKRIRGDASRLHACTRRSYRYNSVDLARLRGETGKNIMGKSNDLGTAIVGGIVGIISDGMMTQRDRDDQIARMLSQCSYSVTRTCEGPRSYWEEQVKAITSAPRLAREQCSAGVERFKTTFAAMKAVDEEVAAARRALQDKVAELNRPPTVISLQDAKCGLE